MALRIDAPWTALRRARRVALAGGLLVCWSCGDDGPVGVRPVIPEILSSAVSGNPHNVISAVVTVRTASAARLRVELEEAGAPAGATPDLPASSDSTDVPVLGLQPDTEYGLRVVATSATGDTVLGPRLAFRSGSLPTSISHFEVVSTGAREPGFTLLAPVRTGAGAPHPAVIVDATGRVVWYREADNGVVDFQLQPNGHFTAAILVPAPVPYYAAVYQEWDELGNLIRTWPAPGFTFTDSHEIRLLDGGQEALLLAFEERSLDLEPFGGPSAGTVVGNVLEKVTSAGSVTFEWHSFDHYALEEADDFVWQAPAGPGGYDFTHANAIDLDRDGNYLLSVRHLSEITKIDAETGEILWRLGKGKGNQFTFLNDPLNGFTSMHSVRRLANGHLILLDNGNLHTPPSSRAVEYALDESARTATLVWSFEPGVASCCMGNAERLPGGNTLVSLGQDYRVFEVSPAGQVVWELRLPDHGAGFFGIYRTFRIPSLYVSR